MRLLVIIIGLFILLLISSCNSEEVLAPPSENPIENPPPTEEIYQIPVVVHVVHLGEEIGDGHNLSKERIHSQIRVLNEDFRRKKGTRGFNDHPDGGDARIEFKLAEFAPNGSPTNGIIRLNALDYTDQVQYQSLEFYASLSYWNPEQYVNIWVEPLPEDLSWIILGKATGPKTDLPGAELLIDGEPEYREGVIIASANFGVYEGSYDYNLGRTLTHELGHYLGLLHTWGTGECVTNDYCEDTPPVDEANQSIACDGKPAMINNYMNYAADSVLNIFTKEQIKWMRYVLEKSPYRKTLINSPAITQIGNSE